MTPVGGRAWLVPLTYAAVALGVYAPALRAFFLGDDYYFLDIVSPASDVRVIFAPLIGRFVRPWVVLLYYGAYKAAGPAPLAFHLSLLTVHVLNAWLVFLIGRRLLPGDATIGAFLAGLLFVLFSSHAEAVAWVAGAADPIVALGLLSAFLCFLRARDPGASPAWVGLSLAALVAAAVGKESWIVFPGLALAYAACVPAEDRAARRRTILVVVAAIALAGAYLAGRLLVFGSVTGGFAGLGTTMTSGHWLREIAKFVFRCFLPAGPWVLRWWPLVGIAAVAGSAALVVRARGAAVRPLLFLAAATLIALAPVLPLSISIVNTESERFTYTATAFSSLLIVCAAWTVLRRRSVAVAACTLLIVWHAVVLAAAARRVRTAGMMARSLAASFAGEVRRQDPDRRAAVFLLNLPDNLGGTYVFRGGFPTAVRIVAPEGAEALSRTTALATHGLGSTSDAITVRQETIAGSFSLDVSPNALIQRELADGPRHHVASLTPHGYRVAFAEDIRPAIVLFADAAGRIQYAGTVRAQERPFGTVDLPADGAACDREFLTLVGWALDDEGVERVRVETADGARVLGEAVWRPGGRPDVAAVFPDFPRRDRAGWEFELRCAAIAGDEGRVRVVALDRHGHVAVLGERRVKGRR